MADAIVEPFQEATPAGRTSTSTAGLDIETVFLIRRPEVIRFLLGLGVDFMQAEDITQEVFLRALNQSESKEPVRNLFAWLLVCARNLAFNQNRRARRELAAPAERWRYWETTIPDGRQGQEAFMLGQERYEQLLAAVASLGPLEQQCIVLRSRGIPFREMAETLNMPLRSAANITTTAIRKLNAALHSVAP